MKQFVNFALFLIFWLSINSVKSKTKRHVIDFFNVCKRSDPEFNYCFRKLLEDSYELFARGEKELNLPPFNPLVIPEFPLDDGNGIYSMHTIIRNLTIYGLNDTIISNSSKATVDEKTKIINVDLRCQVPLLTVTGDYTSRGHVLTVPVQGKGKAKFNWIKFHPRALVTLKPKIENNVEYLKVTKFKWILDTEDYNVHLTNLFNGNKELGDAFLNFLHNVRKEAYAFYRHIPERIYSSIFKKLSNNMLKVYPLNDWLPE